MQGKMGMERAVGILEMWERLSAEDEENDGRDDGMLWEIEVRIASTLLWVSNVISVSLEHLSVVSSVALT